MPTITLDSGPPKRQLIELAFGEIGSAGYEFGRTPEEVNDALMRLNSLMYEWPWNTLGYIQPPYGVGSPDDLSGIPFDVMNGVSAALGVRIAPVMGATLSPEARANASSAIAKVYAYTATIPTMPYHRDTPRGAGGEHLMGLLRPFIEDCDDDTPDIGDPTDDTCESPS